MAIASAPGLKSPAAVNRFAFTSPVIHDLLVLALTLFAPFAVAANQLGGQAVLVLGLGALLWLSPPERKLGGKIFALLAALAAWPLLTLLPAAWLGPAPWHRALGELNVALPFTYSPQPWLTFEDALLLISGLAWAAYLLTRHWHLSRRELLPLYAFAVAALAAVWLVMAQFAPAGAPGETRAFGFFPNRNQSADFLAVGGVALAGLCAYAWRDRSRRVPLWIGAVRRVWVNAPVISG
ncbi:MAG: hypothetical protein HY301_06215 [Verrucomicrobia bacterium]|nr:hypothetical protein [Verrucomicrobiota bacterium]